MKYKLFLLFIFFLFLVSSTLSVTGFLYKRIKDNVNEGFSLMGHESIIVEYGDKYLESGYIARINNKSRIDDVKVESNVNINKIGTYQINYTLSYLNYSKTLTRTIKVIDSVSPELEVKCDNDQYIALKGKVQNCEVKASDNYDKDLTDKIIVDTDLNVNKVGDYKVKYSVADSSKNTVSKEITIHVRNKFDITYVNISISKQKLDYYQNKKLVLTTPVTTGRYNATKTGNFKIRNKVRDTVLSGSGYSSFVKYWMAYDGNSYGLHDASWRSVFGTQDFYYYGSHGCVNLPTPAAKKLYENIEIGTPVYIRN